MTKDASNMTDKQAMNALKKHGFKIIWAILGVLVIYFGWEYYQKNYAKVDTVAADMYATIDERNEMLKLTKQNPDLDGVAKTALNKDETALFTDIDTLVDKHPNTVYAWQGLMLKARHQTDENKLTDAIATLEKAKSLKIGDAGLLAITDLRLGYVLLDNKELEKALTLANKQLPEAFEASRQELLGDIYVAKNDLDNAKKAYLAAWEVLRKRQEKRAVLTLKLQSLGVEAAPIAPRQSAVTKPTTQLDTNESSQDDLETQTTQTGN